MLNDALASARQAFGGTHGGGMRRSRDPFANGSGKDSNSSIAALLPKFPASPSSSSTLTSGGSPAAPASLASFVPSASTIKFVSLCCLWYLSSAFSSNTGKSILTRFRYPVTLTFVQFAFVAGYCVVILALRERIGAAASHHAQHYPSPAMNGGLTNRSSSNSRRRSSISTLDGWGIRKPSRHMFHGTFMMSLFQIAGHVFSSMAIARVPVSTVHTIKALSPLFTVLSYAALFGVRYSSATYVALLPLTIGVMLACSFDLRANAIGFLCALGSTFIFVAQNIFSKKLLPKENSSAASGELKSSLGPGGGSSSNGGGSSGSGGAGAAKLDKLNLLFYSSGMAFFLMIPIWLYSDASTLFFSTKSETAAANAAAAGSTSSLVFFFLANGSVHFAQNLLAFSLLARTSPVTYSIASLIKRIAVICIAIVWSGQHVSLLQAVGMTSTFGGLWMYNRAKGDVDKGEKKRVQVEKRHDLELPSTVGDARLLDGTDTPPMQGPVLNQSYGRRDAGNGANGVAAYTSSAIAHPATAPPPPGSRTAHFQHQLQQQGPGYPSPTVYAPMDPFEQTGPRYHASAAPSPLGASSLADAASAEVPSSAYPAASNGGPPVARDGAPSLSSSQGRPTASYTAQSPQQYSSPDEMTSPRLGGNQEFGGARNRRGSSSTSRPRVSPTTTTTTSAASLSTTAASPHASQQARTAMPSYAPTSPPQRSIGTGVDPSRVMPVPSSLFAPIAAGGGGSRGSGAGGYR